MNEYSVCRTFKLTIPADIDDLVHMCATFVISINHTIKLHSDQSRNHCIF